MDEIKIFFAPYKEINKNILNSVFHLKQMRKIFLTFNLIKQIIKFKLGYIKLIIELL